MVEIAASCAQLDALVNRCQAHGYSLSDLVRCRLCQALHGSETEVAFAEAPINRLTNDALDPVSKIPEYTVAAVRVDKVVDDECACEKANLVEEAAC